MEENYTKEFLLEDEDFLYELTHIEDDYNKSIEVAEYCIQNFNKENFISVLNDVMNEQVEISDEDFKTLILPIRRFYKYINKMPYDVIELEVDAADKMLDNLN